MQPPRTSGFVRLGLTALLGALAAACVADQPSSPAHDQAGGSAGSASKGTSSGGTSPEETPRPEAQARARTAGPARPMAKGARGARKRLTPVIHPSASFPRPRLP